LKYESRLKLWMRDVCSALDAGACPGGVCTYWDEDRACFGFGCSLGDRGLDLQGKPAGLCCRDPSYRGGGGDKFQFELPWPCPAGEWWDFSATWPFPTTEDHHRWYPKHVWNRKEWRKQRFERRKQTRKTNREGRCLRNE
jgi:hypothetical protein